MARTETTVGARHPRQSGEGGLAMREGARRIVRCAAALASPGAAGANVTLRCLHSIGRVAMLLAVFAWVPTAEAWAQAFLVKDIRSGSQGSALDQFARQGNTLLFQANDGTSGEELWKSDGTASGTVLVKDILPGQYGSTPKELTESKGLVFFRADDGSGMELWRTNGTAAGTYRLTDVAPGAGRPFFGVVELADVDGTLFFAVAKEQGPQYELWTSDGTIAGTDRLLSGFVSVYQLMAIQGRLFFGADRFDGGALWTSDGTPEGTVLVRVRDLGAPQNLTAVGPTLFFTVGTCPDEELWKSDGTWEGTVLVSEVCASDLAAVGGVLFFSGEEGSTRNLWKSDGTSAGTARVKSVGFPQFITDAGGVALFAGWTYDRGGELWRSDGTSSGTTLVKDIRPGSLGGGPLAPMVSANGVTYFKSLDGVHGLELWRTDGTTDGTAMVQDIDPKGDGVSQTQPMLIAGDFLFFVADSGSTGPELWALPIPSGPSLFVSDAIVTEGNSGTVDAVFTVRLSAASEQTVTVDFATADGTATAGSDYASTAGHLDFPPGAVTRTVVVRVNGDTEYERTEQFSLNLSNATNAAIGKGAGKGTITNDDLPTLRIDDVVVAEGSSRQWSAATFRVSLSAQADQSVYVRWATANGTAIYGYDYEYTGGMISLSPGHTSEIVHVFIWGDTEPEANETFFVNLSNPDGATIDDGQGQATILDDDATVASISDGSVVEGSSGSRHLAFTVSLSVASQQSVSVDFATADGTAVAGSDYNTRSMTVIFAPLETSKQVEVAVLGDGVAEGNEVFYGNLSNPVGVVLGDGQGRGTIIDDDGGVDFNGDGKPDILWHHQTTGQLTAWLMDGTTQSSASFLTPSSVNPVWQVRGIGDLDGDGKNDLLWHNQSTGALYVWLMNGTVQSSGAFLTPASVNPVWQVQGLADFNSDGKPDILWRHKTSGQLYVWFMNGTAQSSASFLTPSAVASTAWQVRGLGDFNADGKPDILWHNQTSGQVYVWFMNGTALSSTSVLTPSGVANTSWRVAQVADFNGDGKVDILWRNQTSGQLYVWLMNGTTQSSGTLLTPSSVANLAWQISPR